MPGGEASPPRAAWLFCIPDGQYALGTSTWGPGRAEQERAAAALELKWPADGHPAGRLCG